MRKYNKLKAILDYIRDQNNTSRDEVKALIVMGFLVLKRNIMAMMSEENKNERK